MAGCLRKSQVMNLHRHEDWLSSMAWVCGFSQTRGLVVYDVTSSGSGYAVHALKGSSFFVQRNGEMWIPVGPVVPWWSSFRTAFVDSRAGCSRWLGFQELL